MKRLLSAVLAICLITLTITHKVEAGERVVYSFQQLSEHSGKVTLSFYNKNIKDKIQITGYTIIDNNYSKIKVSYVTGDDAKIHSNTLHIYNPNIQFPLKIFIEEAKSNDVKLTDLPKDQELRDHILHLYDRGIVNGRPDQSFGPEDHIIRAEVATLITLAANYPMGNTLVSPFPDVKADYWATKYILPLTQRGILVGNEKGEFRPEANIDIGSIIKIIDATFQIQIDPQQVFETPAKANWSNSFYISLMKKGLVNKTDSFVLPYNPSKLATKGEVATLISRALEQIHTVTQ